MQKQWEVLLPFRGQIVQRATAALRTRDKLDRSVADTLLAIVLLDGLSLDDALELFLTQRLRTLRDILAHDAHGPRRRSSTRRDSACEKEPPKDVAGTLAEALACILDTEKLARTVFEPRRRVSGEESVLSEGIRLIQAGEEALPQSKATPVRTHNRRASRIASISLPLPPLVRGISGPPVSAPRVLQTLPSSQILLRYLPTSVTGFTPFIAPSPAPSLADKLAPWESQVVGVLREAVPSWLAGLNSVADVWDVRASMRELLTDAGIEGRIWATLEEEWGARVQAIWTAKLDALVTSAQSTLQSAADKIRSGAETQDNDPAGHMFSDVAFPSASALAGSSGTGFATFLDTLKKRATHRTPLLNSVLDALESAASDISKDLGGLPRTLYGDYAGKLTSALNALVQALGDVLAEAGGHRDKTGSVEAELFVGRVALYLSQSSGFLADLSGATGVDLGKSSSSFFWVHCVGRRADEADKPKAALMETHAESTVQWQAASIDAALAALLPLFDVHRGPAQVRAEWQGAHPTAPSASVLASLTKLVSAARRLGVPPDVQLETVPRLLRAFRAAVRDLDGWKSGANASGEQAGELAAQGAFDLAFIDLLTSDDIKVDNMINGLLAKSTAGAVEKSFATSLPDLATEALRRTQVVLHPLVAHLPPAQRADTRNAALLRLGAPALRGGVGAEFKSPLAVARPRKRFGLLSIVA